MRGLVLGACSLLRLPGAVHAHPPPLHLHTRPAPLPPVFSCSWATPLAKARLAASLSLAKGEESHPGLSLVKLSHLRGSPDPCTVHGLPGPMHVPGSCTVAACCSIPCLSPYCTSRLPACRGACVAPVHAAALWVLPAPPLKTDVALSHPIPPPATQPHRPDFAALNGISFLLSSYAQQMGLIDGLMCSKFALLSFDVALVLFIWRVANMSIFDPAHAQQLPGGATYLHYYSAFDLDTAKEVDRELHALRLELLKKDAAILTLQRYLFDDKE